MPGEPDRPAPTNGCCPPPRAAPADGPAEDLLDAALAEQRRDWLAGKRTPAAQWLRAYPALASDPARAAGLVYQEFVLRQERGESPDWGDYLRRFPGHAADLRLLRQADRVVEQELAPATPAGLPAGRLGDYELLEEVGRGGMGVVFKARQRSLDRVVALKMIRAGGCHGAEGRKRFDAEARAVARLQHPNIVQIHEVGEAAGLPFLALEFVEGRSLAQHLDGTPWPARQAASLVEVLARAMHYAHERGVIHRDLKPSNVLLAGAPGRWLPKVTDFGLAKRLDAEDETRSGAVLGTPSYMAPEQAEARFAGVDRRTDVYGLGALLYELLTGRPPFRAESPLHTLRQVVEAEPARPRLLHPGVPRDLEVVCLKCLEKDPARRYPSASELADDLGRWLRGEPVRARRTGPLGRAGRWCRRNRVVGGLCAAVATLVVALAAGGWVTGVRQADLRRRAEERHREARGHYEELRRLMRRNVRVSASFSPEHEAHPLPEAMLADAESCLSGLLRRHPDDQELRALLADVLTRLGARKGPAGSEAYFERAARLWEAIPPERARERSYRTSRASTYEHLGYAYERLRRPDRAVPAFETSLRLWQGLAEEHPDPVYREAVFYVTLALSELLIDGGHPEREVLRRLGGFHGRPGPPVGDRGAEVLLDVLRVQQLCATAQRRYHAGDSAGGLAAARKAAATLGRYDGRASLDPCHRACLARCSAVVSQRLRKGGAPGEALRLVERTMDSLQGPVREAPGDHRLLVELSVSWEQVGKARWDLGRPEGALDAYRQALSAQRRACTLAPAVATYRRNLGARYVQLGRKLCELGRLDEAEAWFRERQALWPGDAARQAEALQELRKWAAQVGKGKQALSPKERQERRRYLRLCARLGGKGLARLP